MDPQPDSTILWCLEQLATENVDTDILTGLIKHVTDTRGIDAVEDLLKVRLMLAEISRSAEISSNTLEDLQQIAAMINQTQDPHLVANKRALLPTPELMTLVKTELVAQGWRDSVTVNQRQLITLIRTTFGQQPEAREKETYDKLIKAVATPGYRADVDRRLDGNSVLNGILRYANQAQVALGPTLLQIVNDDINSGNYIPGQPMPAPAPAPAPIVSPPHASIATAPRRASQAAEDAINVIRDAMKHLQAQGGDDPVKEANARAQVLLDADTNIAATALTNIAMQQPTARAPSQTPARPTLPNPPPRSEPEPLRRVSYGGTAQNPLRRRNKRWSANEVERLIEGCRAHGPGMWSKIHSENRDIWENERTQVDLKDKWRNITANVGDKAHRNDPRAVEISRFWQEKLANEGHTLPERRHGALLLEEAEAQIQDAAAAAAAAREERGPRQNGAKRGRQTAVAAAPAEEEAEEEEDDVDEEEEEVEEEAPETTEELEQMESQGEAEANNEVEDEDEEEEAPPASKKAKVVNTGSKPPASRRKGLKFTTRKKARKPDKTDQKRRTRSQKSN